MPERDSQLHENTFLKLDSSKAWALLGWQPLLSLEATLEWIVTWSKAYRDRADIRAFTLGQIDAFLERMPQPEPSSPRVRGIAKLGLIWTAMHAAEAGIADALLLVAAV